MAKWWRLLPSGLLILQAIREEHLRKYGPYRVARFDTEVTEPLYNPVWKASQSPLSHSHKKHLLATSPAD